MISRNEAEKAFIFEGYKNWNVVVTKNIEFLNAIRKQTNVFFCLYNDDNQKTRTYKLKNIQLPDSK